MSFLPYVRCPRLYNFPKFFFLMVREWTCERVFRFERYIEWRSCQVAHCGVVAKSPIDGSNMFKHVESLRFAILAAMVVEPLSSSKAAASLRTSSCDRKPSGGRLSKNSCAFVSIISEAWLSVAQFQCFVIFFQSCSWICFSDNLTKKMLKWWFNQWEYKTHLEPTSAFLKECWLSGVKLATHLEDPCLHGLIGLDVVVLHLGNASRNWFGATFCPKVGWGIIWST